MAEACQKRPRRRRDADGAECLPFTSERVLMDRLHRDVTVGALAAPAPDAAAALADVPAAFVSRAAYAGILAPLLVEEAREELRSDLEEAAADPRRRWEVAVADPGLASEGWVTLQLQLRSGAAGMSDLRRAELAVLSSCQPGCAPVGGQRSLRVAGVRSGTRLVCAPPAKRVTCVRCPHFRRRSVGPWPARGRRRVGPAQIQVLCAVCKRLARAGAEVGGLLYTDVAPRPSVELVLSCGPPRHFSQAAQAGDAQQVCRHVFDGRNAQPWWLLVGGSLTTAKREWLALHTFASSPASMPSVLGRAPAAVSSRLQGDPPLLPPEAAGVLQEHLQSKYNQPQLEALLWAAADADACTAAAAGRPSPSAAATAPITLVQGPPGTGKTLCVVGILNVLHLVNFQRFYSAFLAKVEAVLAAASGAVAAPAGGAVQEGAAGDDEEGQDAESWIAQILASMGMRLARTMPGLPRRPRMLICCPRCAHFQG